MLVDTQCVQQDLSGVLRVQQAHCVLHTHQLFCVRAVECPKVRADVKPKMHTGNPVCVIALLQHKEQSHGSTRAPAYCSETHTENSQPLHKTRDIQLISVPKALPCF